MSLLVDDRELLRQFRDGHEQALTRVYRHYAPKLATFVRSGFQLGSDNRFSGFSSTFDVESAIQEVFSRAFTERARLGYDGVRPYESYLYGIARHVIADELRRRTRMREQSLDEPAEMALESARSAAAAADDEDRRLQALIDDFVRDQLDDRDRRLYQLRYREGLTQQATADAAGLSRIQIRRWETKLRRRLLRHLKRGGYV